MNSIKTMGLEKITDTIFVKEFSRENINIKTLEKLLSESSSPDEKSRLKKDIHIRKQGIEGENNVYFELKNSLIPMLCLHDVRIKSGDSFAQIDFLVITNRFMCVLETKNLVGDIAINEDGDFIRSIKYKDSETKEGMYNPVTQGSRHARLLRKALIDSGVVEMNAFPVKSIAVMANHKNIIDKTKAPENIKNNIYRCDQLVSFLEKEIQSENYGVILTDNTILRIGNAVAGMDTPLKSDYYSNRVQKISKNVDTNSSNGVNINDQKKEGQNAVTTEIHDSAMTNISVSLNPSDYEHDSLVKKFKKLRYEKSQLKNVKPYEVFTNKEMELIISKNPQTIEQLRGLNIKCWVVNEIGLDILKIINPNISYMVSHNEDNGKAKGIESRLREYRDKVSKKRSVPSYEVFTNAEIIRLINVKPISIDQLFEVRGFSKVDKIKNYGQDILNIING